MGSGNHMVDEQNNDKKFHNSDNNACQHCGAEGYNSIHGYYTEQICRHTLNFCDGRNCWFTEEMPWWKRWLHVGRVNPKCPDMVSVDICSSCNRPLEEV